MNLSDEEIIDNALEEISDYEKSHVMSRALQELLDSTRESFKALKESL